MRSFKASGIILRRVNVGEADKILTVFTKDQGKIKVIARGIRRIKSRKASHLELFNNVALVLHEGSLFPTVTEAKAVTNLADTKANLKASGYLFYLAEVIDKILPEHQSHPDVFDDLLATLSLPLSDSSIKKFVVQLLWNLGYLPREEYPKLGVTTMVESIVEKHIRSKKFLDNI